MSKPKKPTMTIEELKLHPLWEQLTQKQQTFVLKYIECGNKVEAANAAYVVKKPLYAENMANHLLKNLSIRRLLAAYYNDDASEIPMGRRELMALISARLRSSNLGDREFGQLTERLMVLKRWRVPEKTDRQHVYLGKKVREEKPETQDVDELVRKLEQEGT